MILSANAQTRPCANNEVAGDLATTLILPDRAIGILLDGMGVGEQAAQDGATILEALLRYTLDDLDPQEALERACQEFTQMASVGSPRGAVAAIAQISRNGEARIAWVGNIRVTLAQKGFAYDLTNGDADGSCCDWIGSSMPSLVHRIAIQVEYGKQVILTTDGARGDFDPAAPVEPRQLLGSRLSDDAGALILGIDC